MKRREPSWTPARDGTSGKIFPVATGWPSSKDNLKVSEKGALHQPQTSQPPLGHVPGCGPPKRIDDNTWFPRTSGRVSLNLKPRLGVWKRSTFPDYPNPRRLIRDWMRFRSAHIAHGGDRVDKRGCVQGQPNDLPPRDNPSPQTVTQSVIGFHPNCRCMPGQYALECGPQIVVSRHRRSAFPNMLPQQFPPS